MPFHSHVSFRRVPEADTPPNNTIRETSGSHPITPADRPGGDVAGDSCAHTTPLLDTHVEASPHVELATRQPPNITIWLCTGSHAVIAAYLFGGTFVVNVDTQLGDSYVPAVAPGTGPDNAEVNRTSFELAECDDDGDELGVTGASDRGDDGTPDDGDDPLDGAPDVGVSVDDGTGCPDRDAPG